MKGGSVDPKPKQEFSALIFIYLPGYAKPTKHVEEYTKVAIKMIRKTSLGYKYYNLNANEIPTDQKRTITEEDSEENLRVEVILIKRQISV